RRPLDRPRGQSGAARQDTWQERAEDARRPLPRVLQRPRERRRFRGHLRMVGEMIASSLLATNLNLDPGSWIAWIVVGLIAGAIAARVVAGPGFGGLADIVLGVAGALICCLLFISRFCAAGNCHLF